MEIKEIIEAIENLRYFESTSEVEWAEAKADVDKAIEALKILDMEVHTKLTHGDKLLLDNTTEVEVITPESSVLVKYVYGNGKLVWVNKNRLRKI